MRMKTLILFSIAVLMTASCTPVNGENQTASPTALPTMVPVTRTHVLISPTEGSSQPITPIGSETPSATAPLGTSPTASAPFTGTVQIAGGSCCIAGFDGETIQAQVSFSAASPFGRVSSMRVTSGCSKDSDLENADWEPFADSKTVPVHVVINWSGFTICTQYRDEYGNLSPIYKDDISVEGMPRGPLVNPTDWYPQIQCFSEQEVHPAPNEVVTGASITFSWPDKNQLPEGVFYKVFAFGESDSFSGTVASGQTRETSITLPIAPERAGEIGWYVTLVDANGTPLDHAQCSSFAASLLTVDPPAGLKAIMFQYQP
jgi:hypothetical protein